MAVASNTLKRWVHPQRAELMNQLPVATTAVSCMTTAEWGDERDLYYLVGSLFYKYDKLAQTSIRLANPIQAPATVCDMRYTMRRGHHWVILWATSTTVRIGGRVGKLFNWKTIRTLTNTGAGQERVLTHVKDNVHDFWVCTGGSGTTNLQDTTKKWKINQWRWYTIGIRFWQDQTEYKTVLYNDTNTIYVADTNLQPHDPWNNQAYVANAPYAVLSAGAATQSHYTIMSQDFTVPAWTVTPDTTTTFTTLTGGIYLVSANAAAPFFTTQYYDVIADRWQVKTVQQGLISAALGTNCNIERTAKIGDPLETWTVVSTGTRSVVTGLTMPVERYSNYRLLITGGTGAGQNRRITCNTVDTFSIAREWDVALDSTSTFEVWADFDRIYFTPWLLSSIFAYSPENDYWMQGQSIDDGICSILSVKKWWDVPFAISTGARILAGIQAINPVPTVAGANYTVWDVLTCNVGGSGASVIVTSITTGGAVTGLELFSAGTTTGYVVGTGRATSGGTWTGCTIEITTVWPTVRVTCVTNHTYKSWDVVTIAGNTDANHNGVKTILCVPWITTFDVATTATANMATTLAQTTTIIVDVTKNWIANEHAWKILDLNVSGTAPTTQKRWIVSNTPNTLTVQGAITAGVSGTSKYVIYEAETFGIEYQYKQAEKSNDWHASSGSTTTLVDSSKNWNIDQWKNYKMDIIAWTGFASGIITVTGNTETTLSFTAQSFTPDTTTRYRVHDCWGLCTAATASVLTETTTKNWQVNGFGGKRCKITAGTWTTGAETIIQTNTATALTVVTNGLTAGDTSTVYAIHWTQLRGLGAGLIWLFGTTNDKGRYMIISRGGGSNTADIYDLTTGKIAYGLFFSPQQEVFTTGTQYAYDWANKVYVQKDNTWFVFEFDFSTMTMNGGMQFSDLTTNVTGTAVVGNRMEIIDIQGLKYLVMAQPTGQKLWKILIIPD